MDVTFKTPEGRFNYRVCAVIVHEGSILCVRDERSPYLYLPGGRVHLHETAEDALRREIREELHADAELERPLWFTENFFIEDASHEQFHELCMYYLVRLTTVQESFSFTEAFESYDGKQTLRFEWICFEALKAAYFYPEFIKTKIFALPPALEMIVEQKVK